MYSLNGLKYDNWYVMSETQIYKPEIIRYNAPVNRNGQNPYETSKKEISQKSYIHERHIKAQSSLALEIVLEGQKYVFEDLLLKTNMSVANLGKKLVAMNLMPSEYTKTDGFDYKKYHYMEDMTDAEAMELALYNYSNFTSEELRYIDNDTITLAYVIEFFSELFPFCTLKDITFSSGILKMYTKDRPLTDFQMKLHVKTPGGEDHLELTKYEFNGETVYDYLKSFYRGGNCFCNTKHINKVVKNMFSIDINSSYPSIMYKNKIPTFLEGCHIYQPGERFYYDPEDNFFLLRVSYDEANRLLKQIKSKVIRQMIVKRFTVNEYVNICSTDLETFKMFGADVDIIYPISHLEYSCEHYGSRDIIEDNYKTKSYCGSKTDIDFSRGLTDIRVMDTPNPTSYKKFMKDNAKIVLNSPYGSPGQRPFYPTYYYNGQDYVKVPDNEGRHNQERNVLFSLYITSIAFYNLLEPLGDCPIDKVDNYFVYCDTDSLYLKNTARKYLDEEKYFHDYNIGKWKIENKSIKKFKVLNHKKYIYESETGLHIACGGVSKRLINTIIDKSKDFDDALNYFDAGKILTSTRSCLTKQGKIAIYDGETKIEALDSGYSDEFSIIDYFGREIIKRKAEADVILNPSEQEQILGVDNLLYISTNFGDMGLGDLTYEAFKIEGCNDIYELIQDFKYHKEVTFLK